MSLACHMMALWVGSTGILVLLYSRFNLQDTTGAKRPTSFAWLNQLESDDAFEMGKLIWRAFLGDAAKEDGPPREEAPRTRPALPGGEDGACGCDTCIYELNYARKFYTINHDAWPCIVGGASPGWFRRAREGCYLLRTRGLAGWWPLSGEGNPRSVAAGACAVAAVRPRSGGG